jgi:predicted cobalt transporter CbtA
MEPWFDPRTAGIIGGIIGGCLGIAGGIIGGSCWFCIRKGWKKFIYGMFGLVITISFALLITGLIALLYKQPYHVWYPFLLSGLLGTIIFSSLLPMIRRLFIEIEMRKMQAKDL